MDWVSCRREPIGAPPRKLLRSKRVTFHAETEDEQIYEEALSSYEVW